MFRVWKLEFRISQKEGLTLLLDTPFTSNCVLLLVLSCRSPFTGRERPFAIAQNDREVLHMMVKDKERIIGTARIRFLAAGQAKLERMAVLKHFRRRGIGRSIISFLIEELRNRQIGQVLLHAQYSAVAFYKSCGFEESGPPFWEAGIRHIKMKRRI